MILAHQKPNEKIAESDRLAFYERFRNLRKSVDIDKPYLGYAPSYQYYGNPITETKYQHEQQAA